MRRTEIVKKLAEHKIEGNIDVVWKRWLEGCEDALVDLPKEVTSKEVLALSPELLSKVEYSHIPKEEYEKMIQSCKTIQLEEAIR